MIERIIIGTRGSALALAQANWFAGRLAAEAPDVHVEVEIIRTRGDDDHATPLDRMGATGVFTAELQRALLDGRVDVAVHSLKDLPVEEPEGLIVASIPERADPHDALVAHGAAAFAALPQGARVGTSSARRAAQLLARRPDLRIEPIRGNVDTRVRKVAEGAYDATVLAVAGLQRLGQIEAITEVFPPAVLLPAPGQGALAVECRANNADLIALLRLTQDDDAAAAVRAERACLAGLGAGCHLPVGALGTVHDAILRLEALACSRDGSAVLRVELEGPASAPEELGRAAAAKLRQQGAEDLLLAD